MPDVQFLDIFDPRYGADVIVFQPVTGLAGTSDGTRVQGGPGQFIQFPRAVFPVRIGVTAGMEFNDPRARLFGLVDLSDLRVNEDAYDDTSFDQTGRRVFDPFEISNDIQAPFGRHF